MFTCTFIFHCRYYHGYQYYWIIVFDQEEHVFIGIKAIFFCNWANAMNAPVPTGILGHPKPVVPCCCCTQLFLSLTTVVDRVHPYISVVQTGQHSGPFHITVLLRIWIVTGLIALKAIYGSGFHTANKVKELSLKHFHHFRQWRICFGWKRPLKCFL